MIDYRKTIVSVWTLATGDVRVPAFGEDEPMTAERLAELRGVLACLADAPIATLEVHPLPDQLDRSRGIPLDAVSPLAQHLSQLITQSARSSSVAAKATAAGEGLYRMVVPAKVAAQFGQGIVHPMAAKGVAGAIRGPLVNPMGRIAAGAKFVPVGKAAAAGGAGATAGVAVAGSAALTVAAPLVLMAVAVGVSANADSKRAAPADGPLTASTCEARQVAPSGRPADGPRATAPRARLRGPCAARPEQGTTVRRLARIVVVAGTARCGLSRRVEPVDDVLGDTVMPGPEASGPLEGPRKT